MKTNKQERRDHKLKRLQQEENARILKLRQDGKMLTIEEQLRFIESMPYEDLRRLDHILGIRESVFERAKIDLDKTKDRQNGAKEIKSQLADMSEE